MAIALVAHTSRTLPGASGAIDTSGASLLVAALAWSVSSAGQATITDSKSNVWFVVAQNSFQSTCGIAVYVSVNPTVGSGHTFTLAGSTATMAVAAFSGTATSFPFSKGSSGSTSSATSIAPGSLTPEVDNCVMISALSNRVAAVYAVDSSYTITDQIIFNSGVSIGVALAYLIETTATAQTPTWSWSGAGVASTLSLYVQTPVAALGNILPVV